MLRNNSDMPKTLKNKMVSGNPRPYSTYCWRIKELCIKLVIWKSLYYGTRSEKHQITFI